MWTAPTGISTRTTRRLAQPGRCALLADAASQCFSAIYGGLAVRCRRPAGSLSGAWRCAVPLLGRRSAAHADYAGSDPANARHAAAKRRTACVQACKALFLFLQAKQDTTELEARGKALKEAIGAAEARLAELETARDAALAQIGNLVHDSVPVDDDEVRLFVSGLLSLCQMYCRAARGCWQRDTPRAVAVGGVLASTLDRLLDLLLNTV